MRKQEYEKNKMIKSKVQDGTADFKERTIWKIIQKKAKQKELKKAKP
jgi:hypothetical protein